MNSFRESKSVNRGYIEKSYHHSSRRRRTMRDRFRELHSRSKHFVSTEADQGGLDSVRVKESMSHFDSRITQKGQVFGSTVSGLSGSRKVGYLIQVLGREVGRIGHRPEVRYEGGINVPDGVPVDTVKEGVSLDLINVQTSVCVAQESVR